MPHIDELFGVTTFAAAGMFAAIALQPVMHDAPATATVPVTAAVVSAASQPAVASIVRLPSIEVVARRSIELARMEREENLARRQLARQPARPKA
jgi:Zn-dependent alcohol dehydrogenase